MPLRVTSPTVTWPNKRYDGPMMNWNIAWKSARQSYGRAIEIFSN